jgi:hypothetical protein
MGKTPPHILPEKLALVRLSHHDISVRHVHDARASSTSLVFTSQYSISMHNSLSSPCREAPYEKSAGSYGALHPYNTQP